MLDFLKQVFTWWNGQTVGTRFFTWRKGERVGEDEFGNVYYVSNKGKRYVQYADQAEASAIPPGWHGWMHYRVDTPPSEETYTPRDWQKPHLENPTGGPNAYFPKGAMQNPEDRPRVTGDYDAWTP